MRWTGVHLQSRKDVGRHTQPSGTGTRAFLRDGRASLCAHVHFHLRHAASRPRRPAGAARHALPLPPAAHVRQGSMRGMRGMRGRHGGGRRGGREAARRRGLARVHTGGQERPKSDDEHTVGSLRRESAPGTRACVRSLSSTSPCDGDTTVSARVQTAVSTPCGGSTQGQRVRGHNRRAARRAQSALGLSYTPAFPAHAQAPPPPTPAGGQAGVPQAAAPAPAPAPWRRSDSARHSAPQHSPHTLPAPPPHPLTSRGGGELCPRHLHLPSTARAHHDAYLPSTCNASTSVLPLRTMQRDRRGAERAARRGAARAARTQAHARYHLGVISAPVHSASTSRSNTPQH